MTERNWQEEIRLLQERERKARELLGVGPIAGRAEIQRAFRQAALAHHPDAGGDDEEGRRFRWIRCAYQCLTASECCAELDEIDRPSRQRVRNGYRVDNGWGYWCWWRDAFFGDGSSTEGWRPASGRRRR